ncbi:MAG: serine/threonine-protein kinase, partial [Acidimicrobiales bacterium]
MTDESIAGVLPDYEIGGELGRGGFGVVLRGRHRNLRRDVAIKELPQALAADPDVRRRFAAEARVLASLSHPHIVPIFDYVERDDHCLLVMELLPGGTVWSQFKDQGFTPESACAVVMATCAGLHYAHKRGVLHRDVKPENLLFSTDGVLKISDFGIAKVIGGSETLATKRGEILGTPAYMAPEQAGGPEPTPTADVYATGVMLYELLSGQLPYSDEGGALAIVYRHVYEDPFDLEDLAPELPVPLVDATMRAIARSTRDRFQTAEDFGVALGEAAATAWGPGWLARADLTINDPGPIAEAAKRPSRDVTAPAKSAKSRRSTKAPPPAPPAEGTGHTTRIRPVATDHGTVAPANLAPEELVPVREVIDVPSPPLVPAIAALVLLILAVAVAFLGLGQTNPAVSFPPGAVTVAGTDVASGEVDLDLARPVEVAVGVVPPDAAAADAVQLGFSV